MDASVSEMVLLKNGGSLKQSRVEEFKELKDSEVKILENEVHF